MLRQLLGFGCILLSVSWMTGCGGGGSAIAPSISPIILPPDAPTGSVQGYIYLAKESRGKSAGESLAISRQAPPPGYIPVAGCTVKAVSVLNGTEKITRTDQNGYFIISGLPEGEARITVQPPVASDLLPELNVKLKEFTSTLYVQGNTTVSLGADGQISLISHAADRLDALINRVSLTDFPQIKIYFEVNDPVRQTPIIGLQKSDFSLRINDNPYPIQTLTQTIHSQEKAALCLALDISPSMEGEPFEEMLDAAERFISFKAPQDEYKLVAFDKDVYYTDFTSDTKELLDALAVLRRWGVGNGTAFYDGVNYALQKTERHPFGSKAVIALTDGGDNSSRLSFEELLGVVSASPVPIYTIGLAGYDFEKSRAQDTALTQYLPWERLAGSRRSLSGRKVLSDTAGGKRSRKESELIALAQNSGAEYFYSPQPIDLAGIYTAISRIKQQQYILETSLSGKRPAKIKVELAAVGFGLEGRTDFQMLIQDFIYPVAESKYLANLTQGFGGESGHLGEDIDLAEREPIFCVGEGTIIYYTSASGYGELVAVVEHRDTPVGDFCSIYGHIRDRIDRNMPDEQALDWRKGDKISTGQIVGFVNDDNHNGIGTEHLHLGIRKGLAPSDGSWVFWGYVNPNYPSSSLGNFLAFSEIIGQLENNT